MNAVAETPAFVRPATQQESCGGQWCVVDQRNGNVFIYSAREAAQAFADQINVSAAALARKAEIDACRFIGQ